MAHDEIVTCENLTERDMTAVAAQLAQYVRAGDMVLLSGDLGMGKSTFARALIRALLDPGFVEWVDGVLAGEHAV